MRNIEQKRHDRFIVLQPLRKTSRTYYLYHVILTRVRISDKCDFKACAIGLERNGNIAFVSLFGKHIARKEDVRRNLLL